MATDRQAEANGRNAQQSTGPRTPAGKSRSSRNALRHGLRSAAPVLPGEDPGAWEEFRAGIARSLAPEGPLEGELANRVALGLWRLRRVTAYETGVVAVQMEEAADEASRPPAAHVPIPSVEDPETVRLAKARKKLAEARERAEPWRGTAELLRSLPDLPDDAPVNGGDLEGAFTDINGELPGGEDTYFDVEDKRFLAGLGVPADEADDPWLWEGWTAGLARRAVREIGKAFKADPDNLLAKARRSREEWQEEAEERVRRLEAKVRQLEKVMRVREDRLRQRRVLLDAETLDKVMRYEAHVGRQMLQSLHTLERLQKSRAGEHVPAPAALDVTVSGDGAAARMLEAAGPAA
jgi:hypothetical protein